LSVERPFIAGHSDSVVFLSAGILRTNKGLKKFATRSKKPIWKRISKAETTAVVKEYRSKASLLGLPLMHCRAGQPHQPAVGWIAIGDRAYGILFAGGGIAVGGIAMGGMSLGVLAMGGACLGVLAFGGLAVGGLSLGGVAVGMVAVGGLALGLVAAQGGLAIAQGFALGGQAFAMQANSPAAREFFAKFKWLDMTRPEIRNTVMVIGWLPLLLIFLRARKTREQPEAGSST